MHQSAAVGGGVGGVGESTLAGVARTGTSMYPDRSGRMGSGDTWSTPGDWHGIPEQSPGVAGMEPCDPSSREVVWTSSLHRAGLSVADATRIASAAAQAVKRDSTATKVLPRAPLTVNRQGSPCGSPHADHSRHEMDHRTPVAGEGSK